MKALSIQQPWAWLIANGYKYIENRTWSTNFRGEFLIHAGKKFDKSAYDFVLMEMKIVIPLAAREACGGIVGIADIVDCVTEHGSRWFFGPYGFVIENARPLPFRPYRGQLGFFEVEK